MGRPELNITLKTLTGESHALKVQADYSILEVKTQIERDHGILVDRQDLIFAGKLLENGRLVVDYNVQNGATLQLIVRTNLIHDIGVKDLEGEILVQNDLVIKERREAWAAKAEQGGYDTDLHIVDPYTHYQWLEGLQKQVIRNSEYCRSKGKLDPLHEHFSRDPTNGITDDLDSVALAQYTLARYTYVTESLQSRRTHASLYCSYQIILRTLKSAKDLMRAGFCKDYFNILVEDPDNNLAEIVQIPVALLEGIVDGIVSFSRLIQTSKDDYDELLTECVELPCFNLLEKLHFPRRTDAPRSIGSMLMLCRMTVLVLDLGLVSYVGSHTSRFDKEFFDLEQNEILVRSPVENTFDFQLSSKRLACLNGFLDKKAVWVFTGISNGERLHPSSTSSAKKGLSILARMEDIADIWGPVYAMSPSSDDDRILRYNVSKGVIRAVSDHPQIRGATLCHWDSWGTLRKFTSKLLGRSADLYMKPGELLLIGAATWRKNQECTYTSEDFEADYAREMGVLGTRPESWRLDSRALAGSVNIKFLTAQLQGTQKLVPQTPIKESIRNKWTYQPQRANPAMLNQYLGVEISHCTGNARRIPLRKLISSESILPILFRQRPGLMTTDWGRMFCLALSSDTNYEIFEVWEKFPERRRDMADLVMRALDIVDGTGSTQSKFIAAFIANDREEKSAEISLDKNNWARLLEDTHMTAVYAFINKVCLECHTPGNTTATCGALNGSIKQYTTFNTMFSVAGSILHAIRLKPSGHRLNHDPRPGTASDMLVLSSRIFGLPRVFNHNEGIEVRDQNANGRDRYSVNIRASEESYGGMDQARRYTRLQNRARQPPQPAQPAHQTQQTRNAQPSPPVPHVPLPIRAVQPAQPTHQAPQQARPAQPAPPVQRIPPSTRTVRPAEPVQPAHRTEYVREAGRQQVNTQATHQRAQAPEVGPLVTIMRQRRENQQNQERTEYPRPQHREQRVRDDDPIPQREDSPRTITHTVGRRNDNAYLRRSYISGANQGLMNPPRNTPALQLDQFYPAQPDPPRQRRPASFHERPYDVVEVVPPPRQRVPNAPPECRDEARITPYQPSRVSRSGIMPNATTESQGRAEALHIRQTQTVLPAYDHPCQDSLLEDPRNYDFFYGGLGD